MQIGRNQDCPCNSGKKYKHCCGAKGDTAAQVTNLMFRALSLQRSGQLTEAEALYREVLANTPNEPNSHDMLGVIAYMEVRYGEALRHGLQATEATQWQVPQILHNLGLTCGRLLSGRTNRLRTESLRAYQDWAQAQNRWSDVQPLVSIAIPSYNHARFLPETLASVYNQTYPNLELIVIDDGSQDDSVQLLEQLIQQSPWPVKLVVRENRGAPATINEAVGLAQGEYINILNSDDCFTPGRIQRMVEEIAQRNLEWGFSQVAALSAGRQDDASQPALAQYTQQLITRASHTLGRSSNSMAFVEYNPAISTGNLFFRRDLFQRIGGFRDLRYNHDWDFCLRAGAVAEPWYVDEPLYLYRFHGSNTISESNTSAWAEVMSFLPSVLYGTGALPSPLTDLNPLSPVAAANRGLVDGILLDAGGITMIPMDAFRSLALTLAEELSSTVEQRLDAPKIAVVVLGMHRSGTSAVSRTLNLAGAQLPENVRPPKLGNNDRGFWEPEELIQINERLLARWALPGMGSIRPRRFRRAHVNRCCGRPSTCSSRNTAARR